MDDQAPPWESPLNSGTIMPTVPVAIDARRMARSLYWRGWNIPQISDELNLNPRTVQSWKQRDGWDDASPLSRVEDHLEHKLNTLIAKETYTGSDVRDIDLLMRQVIAAQIARAKIARYEQPGGHEGHLNDKVANRNAAPKKKAIKNHFTVEQVEELERIFHEDNFDYQETWFAARGNRTRFILKSRQIGATFYFAREALLDALRGGGNQIFLSASKNQAHVFRAYIIQFALKVGVKLAGDPIVITADTIPEGEDAPELIFLGTNARTAQGYHGNFYFDECFWTYGFEDLNKVASGMAMHKKWRRTYMSTPSTVAHGAYAYWTGDWVNKRRRKADRLAIDVSHAALKEGLLCADKVWRHIVTIEDAQAGGCDLFDIDELRIEYAPDAFANLLMCQFVDDSLSAFKFNDLLRCGVDSLVDWPDFNPLLAKPFGARNVWAGYDPQESEDGDNASLVICAPPTEPGGKFRVLERHQLRGLDFEEQADFIAAKLARYRCTYLGVDATGVGAGVYQLLSKRLGSIVKKLEYSIELKAHMIMKAQNVISRGRLEFDASDSGLISSFLSIKKTFTSSGRSITFKASRSAETGHADAAWSLMHILINEPLDGQAPAKGTMETF